jgi:hypothetical protein
MATRNLPIRIHVPFTLPLTLFGIIFSTLGCKYHASVDEFIISKQPPVIYAGSSNKKDFVRGLFPDANEISINPDVERKRKQFGLDAGFYPHDLAQKLIQGDVVLFIKVDTSGTPEVISEFSYNHDAFLAASLKIIAETRYEVTGKEEFYFITIEYKNRYPIDYLCSYGSLDEVTFSLSKE